MNLLFKNNHSKSIESLLAYVEKKNSKIVFVVSSNGRLETLRELFKDQNITLEKFNSWVAAISSVSPMGVLFGRLEEGFEIIEPNIKVIVEDDIFEQSKSTEKKNLRTIRLVKI